MSAKSKLILSGLLLLFLWILVALVGTLLGTYEITSLKTFFSPEETAKLILLKVRVPRVLMAGVAGGVLAVSGAALQALFRNPLASPFTIGVSGGASFGAVLAIKLGLDTTLFGFSSITISAFLFSIFTIFFVYAISMVRGVVATGRLLLAGVVANFLYSALILFAQFFSDFPQSLQTVRWIMGSLDVVGFDAVWKTLIFAVPGCLLLVALSKDMNLFAMGEDVALSLGVNVRGVERLIYFATSLIVSAVISVTGPIMFVGLIIPHIIRLSLGGDNRVLLPCSFLLGAIFLTLADIISRTILSPVEVPVGIITASCGGIFFLWLLMRTRKELIV